MPEDTAPFFHRRHIHERIEKIAELPELTIYAGAGVTIDRSGLDWTHLIKGLFGDRLSEATVDQLIKTQRHTAAGSVVSQLYENQHAEENYQERILDKLRVLLYEQGDWNEGILADRVANLIFRWHLAGRAACVVTPNFDDHIERALIGRRQREGQNSDLPQVSRQFLGGLDKEHPPPYKERVECVYLHGYVPMSINSIRAVADDPRTNQYPYPPILSERDYLHNEPKEIETLNSIFSRSDVLIVGSSLSDPPLRRALLDTARKAERRRYIIVSLQGENWREVSQKILPELKRATWERLRQFNLEPIFADYHIQVGQLLQEIDTCVRVRGSGDSESYSSELSSVRYGPRLVKWWKKWNECN